MSVRFVIKGLLIDKHAVAKPGEPAGQQGGPRRGAQGSPRSPSRKLGIRRPLVTLTALAAAGALAAGCGGNSSSGGSGSGSGGGAYGGGGGATTTPAGPATVTATNTKLGTILVDGNGRTLYLFLKDTPNQSACSGSCAAAWPVYQSSGTPKAGSQVKASLLGTIKRGDGTTQVTYNKHPLYHYSRDTRAGQQNGQGLNVFGARWFVVAPTGSQVS